MWAERAGDTPPSMHEEELDVFVAELLGAVGAILMIYVEPGEADHVLMLIERYIAKKCWPSELRMALSQRFELSLARPEDQKCAAAILGALSRIRSKEVLQR